MPSPRALLPALLVTAALAFGGCYGTTRWGSPSRHFSGSGDVSTPWGTQRSIAVERHDAEGVVLRVTDRPLCRAGERGAVVKTYRGSSKKADSGIVDAVLLPAAGGLTLGYLLIDDPSDELEIAAIASVGALALWGIYQLLPERSKSTKTERVSGVRWKAGEATPCGPPVPAAGVEVAIQAYVGKNGVVWNRKSGDDGRVTLTDRMLSSMGGWARACGRVRVSAALTGDQDSPVQAKYNASRASDEGIARFEHTYGEPSAVDQRWRADRVSLTDAVAARMRRVTGGPMGALTTRYAKACMAENAAALKNQERVDQLVKRCEGIKGGSSDPAAQAKACLQLAEIAKGGVIGVDADPKAAMKLYAFACQLGTCGPGWAYLRARPDAKKDESRTFILFRMCLPTKLGPPLGSPSECKPFRPELAQVLRAHEQEQQEAERKMCMEAKLAPAVVPGTATREEKNEAFGAHARRQACMTLAAKLLSERATRDEGIRIYEHHCEVGDMKGCVKASAALFPKTRRPSEISDRLRRVLERGCELGGKAGEVMCRNLRVVADNARAERKRERNAERRKEREAERRRKQQEAAARRERERQNNQNTYKPTPLPPRPGVSVTPGWH